MGRALNSREASLIKRGGSTGTRSSALIAEAQVVKEVAFNYPTPRPDPGSQNDEL